MVAVCPNAAAAACSGMLPGLVAGFYSFDDCHVDLAQLCTFASARLIHAEAVGIDKEVCLFRVSHALRCIALHCMPFTPFGRVVQQNAVTVTCA